VAVGDLNQSIYGWRGAESDPFNFLSRCVGAKSVEFHSLNLNFRCPREVVTAANAVLRSIVDGGGGDTQGGGSRQPALAPPGMRPSSSSHAPILVLQCQSERDEELAAAAHVRALQRQGVRLDEVAILCRTNKQASSLRNTLEAEYQLKCDGGSLDGATRAQLLPVIAYLQLALAPTECDEAFWSVINVPGRGIGAVAVAYLRWAHAKVTQLAQGGNSAGGLSGADRSVLTMSETLLKRGFPPLPAPEQAAARSGTGGRVGGRGGNYLSMPTPAQRPLRQLCATIRQLEAAVTQGKSPLGVYDQLASALDLNSHFGKLQRQSMSESPPPFGLLHLVPESGSAFADASSSAAKPQPCAALVQMRQMAFDYSSYARGPALHAGPAHARTALERLVDDALLASASGEGIDARGGELTVSTVHGAKGREWDHGA
jgi:superfamily I DNA/RNA helicase